jgi:glycosyltransferase involved in cell wall biosynthesis
MLAVRSNSRIAGELFWSSTSPYNELYALAARHAPSLWLANDWTALPIALRLGREQGVPVVYDTHELATDEHAERMVWRVLNRPMIYAIEQEALREAALVTCVSDGIADRLQEQYGLSKRPLVVRNTPSYRETPFRPTGDRTEVLYHGLVAPGRGLVECIRSVAMWREEFRLTIRGPATSSYREGLEREIEAAGLRGRVRLLPPVPMTDLVAEAAAFDIGLFALPDHSRHNRLALPNKVFEYIMAGLALCVSDLPEMSRILRGRDLGVLIDNISPQNIANAINSLDRVSIDHHKAQSLAAAQEFHWGVESEKLVSACRAVLVTRVGA